MRIGSSILIIIISFLMLAACTSDKYPEKQTYEFDHTPNPEPLDKSKIPEPVFDENPELVDFYWVAWELAWDHVRHGANIPQSPYMDEAHWKDTIWIWDTCFMVHFCKYAPSTFPGIESLNNFYEPMHADKPTSLFIHHPDNPPLFAWTEYEYYKFTNDKKRLNQILKKYQYLQKHFDFFENAIPGTKLPYAGSPLSLKKEEYGYRWRGVQSGMDNTPRGRGDYDSILWLDALAQQGLSSYYIAKIAQEIGEEGLAEQFSETYENIKTIMNTYYWSEKDQIYYDISVSDPSVHVEVKTPAAYWPMLAMMCDEKQAESLKDHVDDASVFGGSVPWPSVSRDDPDFEPKGMYWRGGVWLPTAYMGIKALEKYGYYDTANRTAYDLVNHMYATYKNFEPLTIWEAYSPTETKPGTMKKNQNFSRKDFCGWSALGPISLFIENVLGFHRIDAVHNKIEWNLHHNSRHGIQRLKFGDITTDIMYENNMITVKSNGSYSLYVNNVLYKIEPGSQSFTKK